MNHPLALRLAAVASTVPPPAIAHDRADPAPVVALPTPNPARDTLRRMRATAVDDAHQAIDSTRLLAAARAASQEDGGTCYPVFAAELGILLTDLAMELNLLRGHGACIPGPASQFLRAPLGGSEAVIEYSHDEDFGPLAERALINGRWIEADQFAPEVLEQWHDAIRADIEQQRRDDAETHAVRRYEAARGL
jgi:hypothetical protein